MGGVAGSELAAAVCNAGGLGVLAALRLEPDQVRAAIGEIRERTDQPFGVNLWLHKDVRNSRDPATIPEDVVRGSQSVLNQFRPRFDLDATLDRPPAAIDLVDSALDVLIEEQVPVFSAGLGVPERELVERFHRGGTKVVAMVATIEDGLEAAANGVDVVIAQGTESGGHRSYGDKRSHAEVIGTSTMTLVPAMIAAVGDQVPVVAAGGIVDGRGLAAMLALGADGVLLGTRFVATKESLASDMWKNRMTSGDRTTALTDGFTGQWARVLKSEFTDEWQSSGAEALPGLLQSDAGRDLFGAAKRLDDDQLQPLYAGAAVGALVDVPGAGEVVKTLVSDARASLARFALGR
ncbi:MAG: nitronate monooxygenase [Verrucomicrobiales bacterium]|jgi:nitronate monooxygenase